MMRFLGAATLFGAIHAPWSAAQDAECRNLSFGQRADPVPMQVPGMKDVVRIFPIWGVTGLRRDGTIVNWFAAQRCDHNRTDLPRSLRPLTDVTALAMGTVTLDALRKDGTVWQWGDPWYTEAFKSLTEATRIAAGLDHTLAIRKDGTVWSWGLHGECGEGGAPLSEVRGNRVRPFLPRQVKGMDKAIAVSAGKRVSVALQANGTVWWWGNLTPLDNRGVALHAQLCKLSDDDPNRRPPPQPVPQRVPQLTGVVAIASGYMHHLALKRDGSVWSWGLNDCGQVGTAPQGRTYFDTFVDVPVKVAGLAKVKAIAAGARHSVALRSDGSVVVWGENSRGQLKGMLRAPLAGPGPAAITSCKTLFAGLAMGPQSEDFDNAPSRAPVDHVSAIAADYFSVIVLRKDGTVWTWGAK